MTRFPTQLECPAAEVIPGEPLRCRLRIYNSGDAVDEYSVVGLGDAADWVSTDPPTLALMPGKDGELQVIVTIPADAPVRAGEHHLVVRIDCSLQAVTPQTEDLVVRVAEVTEADVSIVPPADASAKDDDVTATLAVANRGNHPLELGFSVTDHDHDLPARVEPWHLVIEPFQAHTLPLTLPVASCPAPGSHTHRVEVTATAERRLTRSAQATIPHQGPAPRSVIQWLGDTVRLFVVVPVALLLAGLEVLGGGVVVDRFGWRAVAVAVATSLAGAGFVAYHHGALHHVRSARANRTMVDDDLAAGAMWQLAGILLLIPGFLTDLAGVVMAVPRVRRTVRARLLGAPGADPPTGRASP